ncbi:MAG: hypothetical protein Q8O30_13570 [Candidatus Omnitrophota bacterium]|nr:hypothetical protein [Candidatus Omnitrophota bacterium]
MEKKKEKWDKPKLIILMRGKPEESVLAVCACTPKVNDDAQEDHQCYITCTSCWDACVS